MTEPRDLASGDPVVVVYEDRDGASCAFAGWVLYRADGPHVHHCGGPYAHPVVELNWHEDRGGPLPILRYGTAIHEREAVPAGCRFPIRYRYIDEDVPKEHPSIV